jgi:3-deoxy-D-manno-octulosonate 8-phosphate phosphatase (KDO 8-P phosphatase)
MVSKRFLFREDLAARARRIRLVVSDVDGVLTDARVYYSARGEELLCFSRRDGVGFELLADAGIETALLTRESSKIVSARAARLGVRHVFFGIRDKTGFLWELEKNMGVRADQIAYVGDDSNDVDLLGEIARRGGLAFGPSDACAAVRRVAHALTQSPAGHGAFREVVDHLLDLRADGAAPALHG